MVRARGRYFNRPLQERVADRSITGRKLIIVEGPDDIWFFDALLASLGAPIDEVQVLDYEGKDSIARTLGPLLLDPAVTDGTVTAIAIVQDADGDVAVARRNIDEACAEVGLAGGTYGGFTASTSHPTLSIGTFALPDGALNGDLDTLLFDTLAGSPIHAHVESYATTAGFAARPDVGKRKTQTYLASRSPIARGAGMGAANGHFDVTHPSITPVRDFVAALLALR